MGSTSGSTVRRGHRGPVTGLLLLASVAPARAVAQAALTPAAIETLKAASEKRPDFFFGVGTVLDVETARLGILGGASFIVTPSPRPAVITLCRRYHIPVISGAFNLADVRAAYDGGADAVKLFPGDQFGPAYVKTVLAEAPAIALIPIGGVTAATLPEFLRAGAVAAFAGSSLVSEDALRTKNWSAIKVRAAEFILSVATL